MKKNIEHIIKKSLQNHELPYNSGAWDAFSTKLDEGTAPNGDSGSSLNNAIKSSLENYELPYAATAWTALSAKLDAKTVPGVDEVIKSSLNNYELPYAAGAWTALSVSLDAKDAPRSSTKWYVAASILIAAATVSYFVINGSTEKNTTSSNSNTIAQNDIKQVLVKKSNTSTNDIKVNIGTNSNPSNSNPNKGLTNDPNAVHGSVINPNAPILVVNNEPAPFVTPPKVPKADPKTPAATTPTNNQLAPFIMPALDNVCQGTSIKIANDNKYSMSIVYPNGSVWTGKGGSATNLKTSIPGTYVVGYMDNGQMFEEGSFVVKSAPDADLDFVDLSIIWEDGLPSTAVKSTTLGIKYDWKYDKQAATGSEISAHFYTKGDHDIALTVTGANGCKSSITKSVNIEDNYNLFAVKAFDPQDLDSRNNTFMPRALVEREDVKFTLIIIDPNDGHLMYETSDASEGWNGIDRATGNQVAYQKSFIWKVTIENPEQGERSVYSNDAAIIHR